VCYLLLLGDSLYEKAKQKVAINDDELERISRLARLRLDDAQLDLEAAEAEDGTGDDEGWEE
jgi:hypothetical protein